MFERFALFNVPNWDKPSFACLSSRFPYTFLKSQFASIRVPPQFIDLKITCLFSTNNLMSGTFRQMSLAPP